MPQVGTRKRPAPGTLPVSVPSSDEIATTMNLDNQFSQYDGNTQLDGGPTYQDSSQGFDQNGYNLMGNPNVPQELSTQLTRRPAMQQVVSRGSYPQNGGENWAGMSPPKVQQSQEEAWNNDDTELAQRASVAKRIGQASRKPIPPFVQKLSSFLDTSNNTDLIRWSASGNSFIVLDEDEFARTLIPELFKHNNYASFVRQLNMYGFHKKVGLSDNSMRASERKNKSPSEYYNPYFKRGKPDLLWLIQKPKPVQGKSKGGRGKQGAQNVDDEGDDSYEVETPSAINQTLEENASGPRNTRQPLMIGPGDTLPGNELSAVHRELQSIRQQQQMISSVIQKIRREHEQLYGQAAAFQELHNRHENSINAILTFLATVYNRSLEGQGTQNLANLFAGAIPQDTQAQGSVVDVGDFSGQGMTANNQLRRSSRRQPLLLAAPPLHQQDDMTGRVTSLASTPAAQMPSPQERPGTRIPTSPNQLNSYDQTPLSRSGVVQEVYDHDVGTPASMQSPQFSASNLDGRVPQKDFMSFINSANANDKTGFTGRMDFPEALSHLQTADGKAPLSTNQRNSVLQLMANGSAQPSQGMNGNNALTSPTPPAVPVPDIPNWNATKDELDFLERTLKEQDDKVANLSNMLQPLSPSGSIPGLTDYNANPSSDLLDLDQIFNSGDYFNEANQDFGPVPDFAAGGDFDFGPSANGFGMETQQPNSKDGRIVEADTSEGTSPANTVEDVLGTDEIRSPSKKRRRT